MVIRDGEELEDDPQGSADLRRRPQPSPITDDVKINIIRCMSAEPILIRSGCRHQPA